MNHLVLTALLALAAPAMAADPSPAVLAMHYDRVHFSAQGSDLAENDLMQAELYVELQGKNAAALADQANRTMAAALKAAARYPGITARSGTYSTQPIYEHEATSGRRTQTGWRIHQALILEGGNSAEMSRLIGELQSTLRLGSVAFLASPEKRAAAENRAISEALGQFRERARLLQQQLGANGYRLVQINVHTDPAMPPPMPMMEARATSADMAAPAFQPGNSRITVRVEGSIELTR